MSKDKGLTPFSVGLISVNSQHTNLQSTDVLIDEEFAPVGIRDHSSMKNETYPDVRQFYLTLEELLQ